MYQFHWLVQSGKLDFKILKPIDTQFLCTFPFCDIEDAFSFVNALIIFIMASPKFSLFQIIVSVGYFLIGMIAFYSILTIVQAFTFKVTKIESAIDFLWGIINIGKYPITVFGRGFQFIFMFIFPVGLVTTVPARILLGFYDLKLMFAGIVVTILLFIISRKLFLFGLSRYSSASS